MLVIIQARCSSTRLPGKVMMEICKKPILQWVVDRANLSPLVTKAVVATSDDKSDDQLYEYCLRKNIPCFRGPLNDVAGRFKMLLNNEQKQDFVRICADSPLIDPSIISKAITLFQSNNCDFVTNVLKRTFPKGQSVEVVSYHSFEKSYKEFNNIDDYEHVTLYFYKNLQKFNIINFQHVQNMRDIQMSIDTLEDFNQVKKFCDLPNAMIRPWLEFF